MPAVRPCCVISLSPCLDLAAEWIDDYVLDAECVAGLAEHLRPRDLIWIEALGQLYGSEPPTFCIKDKPPVSCFAGSRILPNPEILEIIHEEALVSRKLLRPRRRPIEPREQGLLPLGRGGGESLPGLRLPLIRAQNKRSCVPTDAGLGLTVHRKKVDLIRIGPPDIEVAGARGMHKCPTQVAWHVAPLEAVAIGARECPNRVHQLAFPIEQQDRGLRTVGTDTLRVQLLNRAEAGNEASPRQTA